MKTYLAGKMRGVPQFNRDAFRLWAERLRAAGCEVFSPAEHTEKLYGAQVYTDNPEGDEAKAGIDGRLVFAADVEWICKHAERVALIPGWQDSKGAIAERAIAEALGLEVVEL